MRDAGQGIGRAIDAKMPQKERAAEQQREQILFNLQLKNAYLEGEERKARMRGLDADTPLSLARASQSAVRNQQQMPAMPSLAPDGQAVLGQAQSYPTGVTGIGISKVPTSVRGDSSTEAGILGSTFLAVVLFVCLILLSQQLTHWMLLGR